MPLAQHITHVVDERPHHRAPRARFEQELEDYVTDAAAIVQFPGGYIAEIHAVSHK